MTMRWWLVVCRHRMAQLLLIVSLLSFHPSVTVTVVDCSSSSSNLLQWQIITDSNYSAQIRLNPRLLLLVTVPWSGESRTLMKEIAHVVARDQVRFDDLKLMVLYRNVDGELASALGAENEITVFYYHNASGYKYSGRLRVQNILSSVHYAMSLMPNELPLKSLTTREELRDFLGSTDKAVILFEFCGWTQRLLLSMNRKANEYAFDFSTEGNGTLAAEEKDNMKVDGRGDDQLSCGIDKEFTEMSWSSQFPFSNGSVIEAENLTVNAGASCSLDELRHFDLFLQKFIPLSRKLFLPPERIKFAVASERSFLPLLNIEEPGSWSVSVSFAACPSCLKLVREVGSLKTILQTQVSSVVELQDDDGHEANLPPKRPSILLFVDRSSDLMQVKTESQKALNTFREVAQQYELANQVPGQGRKTLTKSKRASLEALKHSRLQLFKASGKLSSQNKMSVMIINEGQQITIENLVSHLQGSSVQEILSYALKSKKEKTLSSLVKDAGFQLLSKDIDIEVEESSHTHNEVQDNQVLEEKNGDGGIGSSARLDGNKIEAVGNSGQNQESHTYFEADHILQQNIDDSIDENSHLEPQHDHHSARIETANTLGWDDNNSLSGIDINENKNTFQGSFFFFDGQYRLLETLTGSLKIPAVVIIDPISEQHYIFQEQSIFNSSLLSVLINSFLSGELSPYQQSAPAVNNPRSAPKPPFVNLDFHETEYIPLVTTHTFAELVLGNNFNLKSSRGSWNRNVLVLFSNSWCGFCQKMELVVREVYRAIEGYGEAIRINSTRKEKWTSREFADDIGLKLPLIYMMDCTLNDCSLIIEPIKQRDLYPLLVLYPEEMKNNTVVYEGNIAVSDIIKFLVDHGSHFLQDLFMDKRLGFSMKQSSVKHVLQTTNLHPEIVSTDRFQEVAVKYDEEPFLFTDGLHDMPGLSTGWLLIATERLQYVNTFEKSRILIVKLDQGISFQGLIINKQMSWESLKETEEGFEFLKQAPLSFGGPVMKQGMPLVALTRNKFVEDVVEVLPDVYFLDEMATLKLLKDLRQGNGDKTVDDYWFFLGSTSWGWEQLFDEVAQGAWNVTHGSLNQLEWPWISTNDS